MIFGNGVPRSVAVPVAVLASAVGLSQIWQGASVDRAEAEATVAGKKHKKQRHRRVIASDTAAPGSPLGFWRMLDCQDGSRHEHRQRAVATRHPTATGEEQGNDAYRRLTVLDGDDVWGERCELGWNDHRGGPTAVYREGDRAVTSASLRLPHELPARGHTWQVVMQMKQTSPRRTAAASRCSRWRPRAAAGVFRALEGPTEDTRELWTAPAPRRASGPASPSTSATRRIPPGARSRSTPT